MSLHDIDLADWGIDQEHPHPNSWLPHCPSCGRFLSSAPTAERTVDDEEAAWGEFFAGPVYQAQGTCSAHGTVPVDDPFQPYTPPAVPYEPRF